MLTEANKKFNILNVWIVYVQIGITAYNGLWSGREVWNGKIVMNTIKKERKEVNALSSVMIMSFALFFPGTSFETIKIHIKTNDTVS